MKTNNWQQTNIQAFWGNVATSEHLVQVYENDRVFLDSLEGFAGTGFLSGNSVVIVARSSTLIALETRLQVHGFDLAFMRGSGQYVSLDAEDALASFMRNGWPDEKLFFRFCNDLLAQAKNHSAHIRIFGEMVSILMDKGDKDATLYLEELWNKVCEREILCLFCAYPERNLGSNETAMHICGAHSKVIGGWAKPSTEIFYRDSL